MAECPMTEPPDPVVSPERSPVMAVLMVLLSAAVGALVTWAYRVDDRLYAIIRDVPTRQEIQQLRTDLTSRLDRIDNTLGTVLARPQHPTR